MSSVQTTRSEGHPPARPSICPSKSNKGGSGRASSRLGSGAGPGRDSAIRTRATPIPNSAKKIALSQIALDHWRSPPRHIKRSITRSIGAPRNLRGGGGLTGLQYYAQRPGMLFVAPRDLASLHSRLHNCKPCGDCTHVALPMGFDQSTTGACIPATAVSRARRPSTSWTLRRCRLSVTACARQARKRAA